MLAVEAETGVDGAGRIWGHISMLGLMQDWPLLCHRVIDHAALNHPDRQVVSRSVEGPIHTTTYAAIRRQSLRVAKRLDRDGIRPGERVATLAWNTWRHLEAWYGILGIGAVYHTVNPRLFPEQIAWIINHAEDRVLMTDLTFLPLVEKLMPKLPTIERYIVLTDAANMPQTTLPNAVAYDAWLEETDDDFAWRPLDENSAAGMCYTSGTTGNPKGVVYSHRSNVLQAMSVALPDMFGISCRDVVMPVVPMFHANGWSVALAAPMVGASLVMPGPEARWRIHLRAARPVRRHLLGGGAHRVADAAAASGDERRRSAASAQGGDRRRRLPARGGQDLSGQVRRRGDPCLGDDRAEPARHGVLADPGLRRAHRRGAARRAGQAGSRAVHGRNQDRRRAPAPRSRATEQTCGRLLVRGPAVSKAYFKDTGPTCSTRRAISTRAISPRSIRTATCRSPTAPRT